MKVLASIAALGLLCLGGCSTQRWTDCNFDLLSVVGTDKVLVRFPNGDTSEITLHKYSALEYQGGYQEQLDDLGGHHAYDVVVRRSAITGDYDLISARLHKAQAAQAPRFVDEPFGVACTPVYETGSIQYSNHYYCEGSGITH